MVFALRPVFIDRRTRALPVGASKSVGLGGPQRGTSSWRKTLRTDVLPVPAPPVKTLSLRENTVSNVATA